MGRVFVIKAFGRWAKGQDIDDTQLLKAILDAEIGLIAADLGDGLVKLRLARPGHGKSGGFRTIVAFKKGTRAIYLEGWGKNEFENINEPYLRQLKKVANIYFHLDEASLQAAIDGRAIREITEVM